MAFSVATERKSQALPAAQPDRQPETEPPSFQGILAVASCDRHYREAFGYQQQLNDQWYCGSQCMKLPDTRNQHMDLIRVLIAILLPPLGVFLQVGFGGAFWLNILLTLLGYIPGIVHAVWIIAKR
jgi:uncharacterized membrane protein YqaE (UPF0057 family)